MKRISIELGPMMRRRLLLAIVAIFCAGCSYLPILEFHNNTSRDVTLCNLGHANDPCVKVKPNRAGQITLIKDNDGESWVFRVLAGDISKNYHFSVKDVWELHSSACGAAPSRGRKIVVRLDSDGAIYWAAAGCPKIKAAQPDGFPISPSP